MVGWWGAWFAIGLVWFVRLLGGFGGRTHEADIRFKCPLSRIQNRSSYIGLPPVLFEIKSSLRSLVSTRKGKCFVRRYRLSHFSNCMLDADPKRASARSTGTFVNSTAKETTHSRISFIADADRVLWWLMLRGISAGRAPIRADLPQLMSTPADGSDMRASF
ncbi:hypothetical protein BJY04DRAFT_41161 [Aspergillus karnatakaensis]|uniref:uncharacterized protein n=1 Tax=Aspergillus karnatakaensis TaxID=1810916 RepID=UPI003CCDF1F4